MSKYMVITTSEGSEGQNLRRSQIIDTSIIRKCKTKGNTVQICADI